MVKGGDGMVEIKTAWQEGAAQHMERDSTAWKEKRHSRESVDSTAGEKKMVRQGGGILCGMLAVFK